MIRASIIRALSLVCVTAALSGCALGIPADVVTVSKDVSAGTLVAAGGISHEHPPIFDKQYGQEVFASPEQAVTTLIAATRNHNQDAIRTIFGLKRETLFNSGDIAVDWKNMDRLTNAYDKKHWMLIVSSKEQILFIGKDDEQFPIQLLLDKDWWRFDTLKGEEELLSRKIAHTEHEVIWMAHAYVKAQHAYAAERAFATGQIEYARSLHSLHGENELNSLAHNSHHLYHGYYYRILTAQGEHASGGAMDYMENGHLTKGFALLAYPGHYGETGFMTMMFDEKGKLYEKDLGSKTKETAIHITTFDPDKTWKVP